MRRTTMGFALGLIWVATAYAETPAPVTGDWLTADGSATVRIAPCADDAANLCGTIIALKDPNGPDGKPALDTANPKSELRTRPIVGMPFLTGFKPSGKRWSGGKIYDPESGNTYASNMRLRADGSLQVNGCVTVICQEQIWTRATQ